MVELCAPHKRPQRRRRSTRNKKLLHRPRTDAPIVTTVHATSGQHIWQNACCKAQRRTRKACWRHIAKIGIGDIHLTFILPTLHACCSYASDLEACPTFFWLGHVFFNFLWRCWCVGVGQHKFWTGAREHAALVWPVIRRGQESIDHDIACVHFEGQERVDGAERLVEAPERDHCAQITTCTDQSRDASQLLWIHEGHDAIACSLRHLHEERSR